MTGRRKSSNGSVKWLAKRNGDFARAERCFWSDWLSKRGELELEDDANGGLWAPLVSAEILGTDGIGSDTQRPARLEWQVNSAAKGVSEGMLVAKRRLRREVRDPDQSMGPHFETTTS